MAIYNNIYVVLNGSVLAEAVTVETSLERATAEVFSVVNGFEGVTTGPLVRRVSVSNVIPPFGSMYPEFENMMATNEKVELMLQEGHTGRRLVVRGFITSVSRSAGVGQNSELSFDFVGGASPTWQGSGRFA